MPSIRSAILVAACAAAVSTLLSGFLQGAAKLAGKVAAADVALGAGRVTMFEFRPPYRGQSYGTFKMFFNALLERPTQATLQRHTVAMNTTMGLRVAND